MKNDYFPHMRLRGKIRERGLTQEQVAEKLGISAGSLSFKLSGKTEFKRHEVEKLREILEIDPEEVWSYFFAK